MERKEAILKHERYQGILTEGEGLYLKNIWKLLKLVKLIHSISWLKGQTFFKFNIIQYNTAYVLKELF